MGGGRNTGVSGQGGGGRKTEWRREEMDPGGTSISQDPIPVLSFLLAS